MNAWYTPTDQFTLLPAILLALFGCALLLFNFAFRGARERRWLVAIALGGLAFTARAITLQENYLQQHGLRALTAFGGALVVDHFAIFFNRLFLVAALVVILISYRYLECEDEPDGEYYGLALLAQCGMYFLATGADLITLFLGLELMAVCFYITVGYLRRDKRSNEAALKYLLLGGFSSGFLVYGFSLLYGIAGSTVLADISTALTGKSAADPVVALALVTVIAGLLFKISAVPFHAWTPDAYEGAPTTITAYLSVGSKAASFALLLRLLLGPLGGLRGAWMPLIVAASVLSIVVGNLAALSQTNLKRLIAYSSISHAGYVLLGLVAGNTTGLEGVSVYLLVYTLMNLGALLVIAAVRRNGAAGEELDDIAGLARRHPVFAASMTIFLLSLAGIPPTAGFLGKYYIFLSLVQTGHFVLAVVAALYVAVALYYYFRIVKVMYMGQPGAGLSLADSIGLRIALGITSALTLAIGIYPEPFLAFARDSVLQR